MCHCKDVPFGSYLNTIGMVPPRGSNMYQYMQADRKGREHQYYTIDSCIASEIAHLWHENVVTLNSCCGHNQLISTVIVTEMSCHIMKKLGYQSFEVMRQNGLSTEDVAMPKQTFVLKNI